MYPNLYYVFKDWFGVEWRGLSLLNSFGLFVALAFVAAAWVLSSELNRKEKLGLLLPREERITVGKPASTTEILLNALVGFLFGFKILGLFFNKPPELDAQEYIFSSQGNITGGVFMAILLGALKWWDKNKEKLKEPENRIVRIWPHDRVGDFVIVALIFGILGAKIFDNLENLDEFIADPIGRIFSPTGLTFYGGLIIAAVAVCWFAARKGILIKHLVDAAAPCLMIAYAVGRIGCQVSGDGDWGIYNAAYISDDQGKVRLAQPGEFEKKKAQFATYFLEGKAADTSGRSSYVTDRTYSSLQTVPQKNLKGSGFLPGWFWAYPYPQNVNKDGIVMPGITDEHNRVLPLPVFPTPLYETVICTLMFLFMWAIRRRITTPLLMFAIYLVLNGAERFIVEQIRVNKLYSLLGFHVSQAEIIAICLMLAGLILAIVARFAHRNEETRLRAG